MRSFLMSLLAIVGFANLGLAQKRECQHFTMYSECVGVMCAIIKDPLNLEKKMFLLQELELLGFSRGVFGQMHFNWSRMADGELGKNELYNEMIGILNKDLQSWLPFPAAEAFGHSYNVDDVLKMFEDGFINQIRVPVNRLAEFNKQNFMGLSIAVGINRSEDLDVLLSSRSTQHVVSILAGWEPAPMRFIDRLTRSKNFSSLTSLEINNRWAQSGFDEMAMLLSPSSNLLNLHKLHIVSWLNLATRNSSIVRNENLPIRAFTASMSEMSATALGNLRQAGLFDKLESFSVSNDPNFNDHALLSLVQTRNLKLKQFDFAGSAVTDIGIEYLIDNPILSLESIEIFFHSGQVSPSMIERLILSLTTYPKLKNIKMNGGRFTPRTFTVGSDWSKAQTGRVANFR